MIMNFLRRNLAASLAAIFIASAALAGGYGGGLSLIGAFTPGHGVNITANGQLQDAGASAGSGTVTQINNGWGVTGGPVTGVGALSLSTTNPARSCEGPINLQLNASAAASALTIALKANDGTDPSGTNPVLLCFRDPTIANGGPIWISLTAANSLTINSGASLGAANATPFRIWLVAFNDAGTIRIGVINALSASTIYPLASNVGVPVSSTIMSAGSTSSGTFYTNAAVTSKSYAIIGYFEYSAGLTTAGTWASAPTKLQLFSPGIPTPGQYTGLLAFSNSGGGSSTASTSYVDVTGATLTVTPTAAMNAFEWHYGANQQITAVAAANTTVSINVNFGASSIQQINIGIGSGAGANLTDSGGNSDTGIFVPFSASAQTFKLQHKSNNAGATATTNNINMYIREIMT